MVKLGVVSSSPFLVEEGGAEKHVLEFLRRARKYFDIFLFPSLTALVQEQNVERIQSKLDLLEKEGFAIPDTVKDLFNSFRPSRKEMILNYMNLSLHKRLVKYYVRESEKMDFLFSPNFLSPEAAMMGRPYGILVNAYLAPLHMDPIKHALWKARIGQEPLYVGLPKSLVTSMYWLNSLNVMKAFPPKFIAGVNKVALMDKLSEVPGDKVLIDPGFAIENISVASPKEKEEYAVFMAARLVPSKGLFDILEVAKRIRGKGFKIVVLGRLGVYESSFQKKIMKYGLEDTITYRGYITGEEKKEILSRAKVLIYPSHDDTNSIVVLESLALGTPVVAYDIPGLKFVYEGVPGVEFVREFDYDTMALRSLDYLHGLKKFHYSPELKRFLDSHSSWEVVINQEIETIQRYI